MGAGDRLVLFAAAVLPASRRLFGPCCVLERGWRTSLYTAAEGRVDARKAPSCPVLPPAVLGPRKRQGEGMAL